MEDNKNVQTSVKEVDLNIDEMFAGAPGAESVITPENSTTEVKPNMFSKRNTDLSFMDKLEDDNTFNSNQNNVAKTDGTAKADIAAIVDAEIKPEVESDDTIKNTGRPKTDKNALVTFLKKRIDAKEMFAFDDYDEKKQTLDEYLIGLSEKDVDDLWQANINNLKESVASNTPQEFFESLPEELQYAAKYVADGGKDMKGLFAALASVEAVRQLDVADENDQEGIVRSYLQATNFGNAEEITEEINTWKDLGTLEKKAKQFKPKLDQMQEQIVLQQLAEQEARNKQQQAASQAYVHNVFEALRPAEINGLKLDKKVQAQLYSGLVQPQYPSISGRPTNLLGHLLEKYQYVEPNYPLIAEALWLLSNPDEYRGELRKQGKNENVVQTVKSLKIEQSNKNGGTHDEENDSAPRKITRPQNIFKR